ncbi:hypothetical protein [Cereibacter sphaeroides]|uniref:hypothetical protein n=1 Tax=Cereibacter sphaeroides TaxID=1063 RepID=UPI001F449691|nr:hypothetical protein [Cereibacter sphaeroides]MCE6967198.1 hypothetical protein [Cereibacter sphaeroides]
MLEGPATETLATASGATVDPDPFAPVREIGEQALTPEKVSDMKYDLDLNPPRPFDLTRRLTVFTSEVQYVEVKMSNALFSARTITLPSDFQKIVDEKLRNGIRASLKIPVDPQQSYKITVGGKVLHVSEAYLKRERASLEAAFLYDWKGRGKVIFRTDRDKFQAKLKEFIDLTAAYQEAVKADLAAMRASFCEQMVNEFLPHWKDSPPARLRHRDQTNEQSLIDDITERSESMFNAAVEMGAPEAKDIYKDISIEDLDDAEMMKSLKDLMEKARVPAATIAKLFSKDEAIGTGNGRQS